MEYEDVMLDEEAAMTEKLEYEKLREQFNRDNFETLDAEEPTTPAPSKKERVRFADETENKAAEASPLKENIGPSCEENGDSLKPSSTPKASVPPKAVLRERQAVAPKFQKILPAPRKFSCISIDFSDKPTLPDHLPARESRGNAPSTRPSLFHIYGLLSH